MSVKVSNVTKIYGSQKAVDSISFEAGVGVLGFLGPNGAGKSTTMKILTCFVPQTEGTAEVCGYNVSTQPLEVTRNIGYLPENNPLYTEMYVAEYLQFMGALNKVKNIKKRAEEMIEVTGLGPERKKKVGQLSRGYRQRVGIAQALLHDPKVLILDEPTSGLDPNQLVEIRSLIKQLGKSKTIIFSTHIMQEVEAVADRVLIINRGKIVADDTTVQLQSRLLGSVNIIVEFQEAIAGDALKKISGVKAVQLDKEKYILTTEGGNDLRAQIFQFAKQQNLTLLSLYKEESRLEDVFKELTK